MTDDQPQLINPPQQNQTGNVAWFYGRFSDAETQNTDSIDQQLLACKTHAAKHGRVIRRSGSLRIPVCADGTTTDLS